MLSAWLVLMLNGLFLTLRLSGNTGSFLRLLKGEEERKYLELARLLREDYRRRYQDARLYLKTGSKHLSLAYGDIYAAEAALYRVFLHLRDGKEEWSGSLTELVRYEARLDNGQVIPVSKRLYKPAVEQYIAFLKN